MMFRCGYKAYMTEKYVNKHARKRSPEEPCERHLGLLEPMETKDFILLINYVVIVKVREGCKKKLFFRTGDEGGSERYGLFPQL